MGQPFRTPRNVELSTAEYLDTNLASAWPGTTVLQTFAQVYAKSYDVPIVCVRLSDVQSSRLEVGSDALDERFLIVIDIFAKDDGQRLDLAAYIKGLLQTGWVNYEHSRVSGDTTGALSKTVDGRCWVTQFVTDAKIDIGESVDTKDRYRHNISIRVRQSP